MPDIPGFLLISFPWGASCSNYFRAMVYENFCFIWESLCFHSWRIFFFFLNTEFWFCSHFLLALEIHFCIFFLALWFLVRNVQLFEFLFIYKLCIILLCFPCFSLCLVSSVDCDLSWHEHLSSCLSCFVYSEIIEFVGL